LSALEKSLPGRAAQTAPSGAKKRVVFLINSLVGGGAERVMATLLKASKDEAREFDLLFATLDEANEAYELPGWIERRRFDCRASTLKSFLAVRSLCADFRPDVVVSFLTRANVANVAVAPRFGAKAIISERVNTSAHFSTLAQRVIGGAMVRAAYPHAERIAAVSIGVADDLVEHFGTPREKIVVIDNPVDIETISARALETPEFQIEGPYVLAVGRLTKNKNFEMLIEAFARSGIEGKLVILGQGELQDALRAHAAAHGVGDRVLLPGFAANPYALMRRAQIFALPSNAEGFPNGLVEAMAAGAPVVSTNCRSGPSEILAERGRHQVNGLTCAKHGVLVDTDNAEQMAEALRRMQDPHLRNVYAERAQTRARHYSVEAAKNRYWGLVRDALGGAG
jgi:N-acetylgalactosamine-N,N'-diacetylbacillosaminyl-diphospho-undecaprenol 4-alpha-N-acetylgalactosaminyltransferase